MTKKTQTITPQQAAAMGPEVMQLMELAKKQLDEHKVWLKDTIATMIQTGEVGTWKLDARALIPTIDDINLEMVRIEPAMKAGDANTVSVVYAYPDALHDFLSRPEIGKELNIAAQGGITL